MKSSVTSAMLCSRGVKGHAFHLLPHASIRRGLPVTQRGDEDAANRIEVALAFDVPEVQALSLFQNQRVAHEIGHLHKSMQVAVAAPHACESNSSCSCPLYAGSKGCAPAARFPAGGASELSCSDRSKRHA